ncbi:IS3 family transposase [Peribacillus sp. NPDC006672]|uniref:IS3 family transposase n=1 Tax=Peribacillus sp. NPDC006672 TaxID=3390606 RepID=UPI003D0139F4
MNHKKVYRLMRELQIESIIRKKRCFFQRIPVQNIYNNEIVAWKLSYRTPCSRNT